MNGSRLTPGCDKAQNLLAQEPSVRKAFLASLSRYGNLQGAGAQIGLSPMQTNYAVDRVPGLAQEVEMALAEHRARIDRAVYERGVEGWEVAQYGPTGIQVGTVRKYSDPLLIAYAKRHLPEYREESRTKTEVTVSGTVDHRHEVDLRQLPAEQRAALRVLLGAPPPALLGEGDPAG